MSADSQFDLAPGSRLGAYEIKKQLGAGGMGAVYLATDMELRRPVALKVLRREKLSQDDDARRRLVQEAQAASRLNHPNIVTVYQIGSEAGVDFIAMEYVDGQSLQARIPASGLGVEEALQIAIQVADALTVAHEAGIVHRDLKPANIMLTDRGRVKVVDFGLAKRSAAPGEAPLGDKAETESMTRPGQVVGTSAYMAPEQIVGGKLDGRTDIWALGCVMYRMLTGHNAFHEETGVHTMAAVLTKQPERMTRFAHGVPPRVERVIDRCLAKKVEERWQSVTDLRFVLGELAAPREIEAPKNGRGRVIVWSAAVLLGGLLGAAAMWLAAPSAPQPGTRTTMRMATLDSGLSTAPSLSRDGALLAYASDRGSDGNLDIWLQQVDGRQPIRLTDDPADDSDPSISPDGTKVVFRSERAGGGIYEVPALGGEAALIAAGGRSPKYSPDGRWIGYWTGRDGGGYLPGSAKVWVVEAGGGSPREIGSSLACASHPVWSQDGSELLVLGRKAGDPTPAGLDWWALAVQRGTARPVRALALLREGGLLPRQMPEPAPLEWNTGKVYFTLRVGDAVNLWRAALPAHANAMGTPERVTLGPGRQIGASFAQSASGPRLAFAEVAQSNAIWLLPSVGKSDPPRGAMTKLNSSGKWDSSPSLSADSGKLAWIRRAANLWAIVVRDLASGKEAAVLRSDRYLANAVISGDGRRVLYSNGSGDVFGVASAGGASEALCAHCGTVMGASHDGARLLYEPLQNEDLMQWDASSRSSVKVAARNDSVLSGGRYSPDGRWVAFHEIDNRTSASRVWIAPAVGPFPVARDRWVAVGESAALERNPAWSADAQLLYYAAERDGFRCIWARRLDREMHPAGEPIAIQHFHSTRWSMAELNGYQIGLWAAPRQLVFALREQSGNLWLQETAAK